MRNVLIAALLFGGSAFAQTAAKPAPAPAGTAATDKAPTEKADTAAAPKTGKKAAPMDINTASADELKTLPGIDDATAQKIIAGRPYRGKDQLLKNGTVDKDEYAKIRPLIHAKQPKKAAGATPAADTKATTK